MKKQMKSGWNSIESIKSELADDDTWLKGFFASQHDNWDGKYRTRNFHELRCIHINPPRCFLNQLLDVN